MGLSQRAHKALWPVLLFFQAIGDIAWLPILVIWFGYGLTTMTVVIVYTVIFPVVLNTVLGVRSIPITLHRAALSLGASRARMLWEVVLPGALPNMPKLPTGMPPAPPPFPGAPGGLPGLGGPGRGPGLPGLGGFPGFGKKK